MGETLVLTAIDSMKSNHLTFLTAKYLRLFAILAGLLVLQACTTSNVGDGLRPVASVGTQDATTPPDQSNTIALAPVDSAPDTVPSTPPANAPPGLTQPGPVPHNTAPNPPATASPSTASLSAPPTTPSSAPSPGVTFLPVVGPPQSAVTRLSAAVKNSARTNGVTIIANGQSGATYQVKGYFSALDDGSGTRFIFIWDVLDGRGKNIYRISGEERTVSRGADPWSAIDANVINSVVERTMQNLRGWMATRA